MANDHYISRFLTRPWEHAQRELQYYDFESKKIERAPSKRLFAADGLNRRETEDFINYYFERPMAELQAAVVGLETVEAAQAVFNAGAYRAYAGLFWLQVPRLRDAEGLSVGELDSLAAKGEEYLDELMAAIHSKFDLVFGLVDQTKVLFFPDTVIFAVPAILQQPVICMPLTTHVFLAFLDREHHVDTARQALEAPLVMNFSVGLKARRVLIPPECEPPRPEWFEDVRRSSAKVIDGMADFAADLGFPRWGASRKERP